MVERRHAERFLPHDWERPARHQQRASDHEARPFPIHCAARRRKPDRVVFKQPATLTISYSNCSLANATQLKVAQVSDVLQIIQYVPSTNDLDAHTVTGQLQHFSNYGVAW